MSKKYGIIFVAFGLVFFGSVFGGADTYATEYELLTTSGEGKEIGISWDDSCGDDAFKVHSNTIYLGELGDFKSGNDGLKSSISRKLGSSSFGAGCYRGKIESVIWAAAGSSNDPETPYCAMWIGDPVQKGYTYTEVAIDNEEKIGQFILRGMCSKGNTSAKHVGFTEVKYDSVYNWSYNVNGYREKNAYKYINDGKIIEGESDSGVLRSMWTNGYISGTVVKFDVEGMMKDYDAINNVDGVNQYTKYLYLWRCNSNRPENNPSCLKQKIAIVLRDYVYATASSVSIGKVGEDNSQSAYAQSLGIGRGENVDFTDMEAGLTFRVGDTAEVGFSHTVSGGKTDGKRWAVEGHVWGEASVLDSAEYSEGRLPYSEGYLTLGEDTVSGSTKEGNLYYKTVWDKKIEVKFNSPGRWIYCERIRFPIGSAGATHDQVCAVIDVKERDYECADGVCPDDSEPEDPSGPGGVPGTIGGVCNEWTPQEYTSSIGNDKSGYTKVVSKVKNVSVGAYNNWSDAVYAKPGDKINWVHCYYPGVQYLSNLTVTEDNLDPEPKTMTPTSNSLNNISFSGYSWWQNQYTISSNNMTLKTPAQRTYSFGIGTAKIQKTDDNAYSVEYGFNRNKAGKTIQEINTSGIPSSVSRDGAGELHSWNCNKGQDCDKCGSHEEGSGEDKITVCDVCYLDTCEHINKFYENSHDDNPVVSHADVHVPYNFNNTASIALKNGNVYAGETVSISSLNVYVKKRENITLGGEYATQVDDAKIAVVGYVSKFEFGGSISNLNDDICKALRYEGRVADGSCDKLSSTTMILNSGGDMNGSTDSISYLIHDYNVYDADAGKYFCVVAAVYPQTVGGDLDMNADGSKTWYVSEPSCRVIAKKPTFQILGGSLYSAGDIYTTAPVKNNLLGINDVDGTEYSYAPTGGNTAAFNSWVEQGVVAIGSVKGLASGAATGINNIGMYGNFEFNNGYCDRVPLSFANDQCATQGTTGNVIGGSGGSVGASSTNNPGAIADYWLDKIGKEIPTEQPSSDSINISEKYNVVSNVENASGEPSEATSAEGAGTVLRYNYYGTGDLRLGEAIVPVHVTHVVKAKGNIKIEGNITYEESEIALLSYIPKLIIYAEGDIDINCNVKKVEAILVAKGKLNTCAGYWQDKNQDAEERSNQLVINGAVIAGEIEFNRTYGAGTGVNSGEPAEIINYDTSSILWGRYSAGSSQSNNLTMTYQHELAPRL